MLQGTLEGGRKRGRQVKCWADNLKEWTRLDSPTLTRLAEDRPAHRIRSIQNDQQAIRDSSVIFVAPS